MSDPIPVVVCGKQAVIATAAKKSLEPEYEVIHVVLSPAAGASEIPVLLEGGSPLPVDAENVGTKNYSKPPVAVILGGGYDDAGFAEMRAGSQGKSNVPWLRNDRSKPPQPGAPGYPEAVVERIKACLRELAAEGKMEGDGIYWY